MFGWKQDQASSHSLDREGEPWKNKDTCYLAQPRQHLKNEFAKAVGGNVLHAHQEFDWIGEIWKEGNLVHSQTYPIFYLNENVADSLFLCVW